MAQQPKSQLIPSGVDLMRRINDGELKKAPMGRIEAVKKLITENCEELIEGGARIRPLLVGDEQIGWARGLHLQERLMLRRWVKDPNDFVGHALALATSLAEEEIDALTALEARSLAEVVKRMTEYDTSLFPFLSAYVTTQSSENLWYGQGEKLTSYENKVVLMPDGKRIKLLVPPDHARMWASLCTYREQAKRRLEDNFNSLFIVRPWAGRSADPISAELKNVARSLETDSTEPWERVVRKEAAANKDDGWAHAGDSVEDMQRELKGMISGDKHERLMDKWQKQMEDEAEATKRKLSELRAERRGDSEPGIIAERMEVFTDKQVKERQAALRKGLPPPKSKPVKREDYEVDAATRMLEKLKRYR
jgi:hypothetical protein